MFCVFIYSPFFLLFVFWPNTRKRILIKLYVMRAQFMCTTSARDATVFVQGYTYTLKKSNLSTASQNGMFLKRYPFAHLGLLSAKVAHRRTLQHIPPSPLPLHRHHRRSGSDKRNLFIIQKFMQRRACIVGLFSPMLGSTVDAT